MSEQSFLSQVRKLPPLPAAAQQLLAMGCDSSVGAAKIAEVVSLDPALTTKVLQVANSAFYGLSRQIPTVEEAAVIIGVHGIRNLALGVALAGSKANASPALGKLWEHSLGVAVAARHIAAHVGGVHKEIAFTAGLIHDIGRSVLLEIHGDDYLEAVERSRDGPEPSLVSLEREAYGLDHAQAGEMVCKHWKIPSAISSVVARHHDHLAPSGEGERLERVVRAADALARLAGLALEDEVWVSGDDLTHLGPLGLVPGPAVWKLMRQIPHDVATLAGLFGLETGAAALYPDGAGTVGLLASTPGEVLLVGLALSGSGYTPLQLEGSGRSTERFAVVSVRAGEALVRTLEQRCARVLDVQAWRRENSVGEGALPTRCFQRWVEASRVTPRGCAA